MNRDQVKKSWSVEKGASIILLGWLLGSTNLKACAVCFGNKDSIMTQSLGYGVLTLLAFLMIVLLSLSWNIYKFLKKDQLITKRGS